MPNPLKDRFVALGVSGSIACYKAVDLVSKLTQAGALVDVIMTRGATNFVSPLSFESITHRRAITGVFEMAEPEAGIGHVAVAERAEVFVIAPATAHTIARMAWGFADDALTTAVLATKAPVIVCPAMDGHMFQNPATQENIAKLKGRGMAIAGPDEGYLASGMSGAGRMLEPEEILGHVKLTLGRGGDLSGRKIVVSAGGTREAIDPARYISNRSSGKMGYAVAEAARDRGANAVLVSASDALPDPVGVRVLRVGSALEMRDDVVQESSDADALIMAAAVADWRPEETAEQKLKKGDAKRWRVELVRTPDIVADLSREGLIKVGFAAESQDLQVNAAEKLREKGLDLIAANDITAADAGFGADTNRVVLMGPDGQSEELELMSKYEVGHRILDRVAGLIRERS